MPIYEYRCKECGSLFEVLRPIKEADFPIPCKKCSSEQTTRQISLFFAQSGGKSIASTTKGCAGCSGGACSSCSH